MSLARYLANGHGETCCILCQAGWLWQAELGVASREFRRLVLEHRRRYAEHAMCAAASGRCVDCGGVHNWARYVKAPALEECSLALKQCKPPPWVCHFGAGVLCSTYRAALFLRSPYWTAWEILEAAGRGSRAGQDLESEEGVDGDPSEGSDSKYARSCAEGVQNQVDALRSQGIHARRQLGGVRISPRAELTTAFPTTKPSALPREYEDAADVRQAAALFWIMQVECRADLPWLEAKMMDELVNYFQTLAERHFAQGWRALVGYASDMLAGFRGYWMGRLLQAKAVAYAGIYQPSLVIYLDGRWSFAETPTWSCLLKRACYRYLLHKGVFRKRMSPVLSFIDIDTHAYAHNFEAYALKGGCYRFAGFLDRGLDPTSPHSGDVLLFMEKYVEAGAFVISGAEILA
jgi:hypothetical protein